MNVCLHSVTLPQQHGRLYKYILLRMTSFIPLNVETYSLVFLQQDSFQRLLHKLDGNRAEWEYPFAVAGINISFMLIQMLDLQSGNVNF